MIEHENRTTTRRQAIGIAGATGVAFLFAGAPRGGLLEAGPAEAASATCVMTPEKTEGPYFVDEKLNRTDIRGGQPGTTLTLTMYVFDADDDCAPVSGAMVDIWHASASGRYSDIAQNDTTGENWLRGYQLSDAKGKVTFTTIWPGWYQGRAVHIHFKVRSGGSEFTSQMFFTDEMNDRVFAAAPYAARGDAETLDGEDGILGSDASTLTLHPSASGGGYAADFSVGLSLGGASEPEDAVVAAAFASAKVVRLASGRRQLRIRLKAREKVTLAARVTRNGHRLAYRKVTRGAGTHVIRLSLGSGVRAGAARLTLKLADGSGNRKNSSRSLHVPKRR